MIAFRAYPANLMTAGMAFGLLLWLTAGAATASEGKSGSVTVITDQDIARERPPDLITLLRSRVGLDVTGGNVTMRGVRGVVFVLDGFTVGAEEINQVRPEQVVRIEIQRGADSARYGANAMGGAVWVTTRQDGTTDHSTTTVGISSSGSRFTRLSGRRTAEAFTVSGLAEHQLIDGYRRVTKSPYAYNITVENERYEKTLLDTSAGWHGTKATLGINLKYRENLSNLGRPHWWWDDRETTFRASGQWIPVPDLHINGRLGWSNYSDQALKDAGTGTSGAALEPALRFFTDVETQEGEFGVERTLPKGRLTSLFSASRERNSDRIYDEVGDSEAFRLDATTDNLAFAGGWESLLSEALQFQLGIRYDRYRYHDIYVFNAASDPSEFQGRTVTHNALNGKAILAWSLSPQTRLSTSVGTGFLPPTPGQLYYTELNDASWFLPNPQLKPQRALTLDATLAHESANGTTLKLTVFHTRWRDKIGPIIIDYGTPVVRQYQNLGAAESNGLELELRQILSARWTLALNYTYNRTRITGDDAHPDYVGNELPDMPRHKLNLSLDWNSGGHWTGRLLARHVGSTWTDEANTTTDAHGYQWRKEPYTTLDANLAGKFGKLEFTLAGDNLFDRHYRSGFFWRDEGRVLRAELAWNF